MRCQFCDNEVRGLIYVRRYTRKGVPVCEECYHKIDAHRYKPYSKVMDKLALLEAGYLVNRKLARSRI